VPKYGEYSPAGSAPAYGAPVTPPNPYGVPAYGATPAPSAPAAPAVPTAPQYGQSPYGVAATGAPGYAPVVKKRRTWDVIFTVILLVVGLFGTIFGLIYAGIFANPSLLSQTMQSQGFGSFTGDVGAAPVILLVSHVVLFLLAVGISIPLLIRGRIVVFWVPLAAGVIAAIIFWSTVIGVFLSDPSFVSRYGG
jgi:hypothetical protein